MLSFRIFSFIIILTVSIYSSDKEIREGWAKHYKSYKGEGCFVLYDLKNDKYFIYNEERANTRFIPASTYKIPNSLIALETGVIKDENEIIKWDGIKRRVESWNKDHSLRSAIKVSAVWFYQELARRIGAAEMQKYVNSINYGNKDIRDSIDTFWLDGKMRISAVEQIEFLKKLYSNDLPFSGRSLSIVKDILINEQTDKYTLRAKTGWASTQGPDIGWWVGWIETNDNVYFFANNMEIINEGDENGRIEIAKNILREMKIYP